MKILTNDYCSNGLWKEVSAAKSLCLEIISMIINVILISAWNCMHPSERKIHKMPAKTNETARKNEHMHQKSQKTEMLHIQPDFCINQSAETILGKFLQFGDKIKYKQTDSHMVKKWQLKMMF